MKSIRVLSFQLLVFCAFGLFAATTVYAVERNPNSSRFNWGDDLSEETDSPGSTQMNRPPKQLKANHIPDIKSAIDQSVTACGISADVYSQTDREAIYQIGRPGQVVSSRHVNNLRRAIERLYGERGDNTIGNYFTGNVSPGDPIRRQHIHQMRRALDDLSVSCTTTPQPACTYRVSMNGSNCGANAMNIARNYEGRACTPPDDDVQDLAQCTINIRCACDGSSCVPDGGELTAMGVCQPGDNRFQTYPDGTGQCCSGWIRQSCPAYYEPWEITCVAGASPCGNGIRNAGEQCDDGNTVDGDGCSATCQTEVGGGCPPGSDVIGFVPIYQDEQGCLARGRADCEGAGKDFSGSCTGGFQPCCIDTCENDGYTWNRGGLPRYDDEIILDGRCCSGTAVCPAGTTTCSCERAGGGGAVCGDCACTLQEGLSGSCPGDCDCFSGAPCFSVTCGGVPPPPPPSAVCGNGVVEAGEACDLGMAGNGACPRACSASCTTNSCGGGGTRYRCRVLPGGGTNCVPDPNGFYDDLIQCQDVCAGNDFR